MFCRELDLETLEMCFTLVQRLFPDIRPDDTWAKDGITVAGGYRMGRKLNQLDQPNGLYVNDDQTIYIADYFNHRIME